MVGFGPRARLALLASAGRARGNRRRDPSGAATGPKSRPASRAPGLWPAVSARPRHGPGWSGARVDLGGEQSPWKDRVFVRRQRRTDTTDSSTEQGPEVGRSRRLEESARRTSVRRACEAVVRGFGRRTARGAPSGAPVMPTCSRCAVMLYRPGLDRSSSALRRCTETVTRVPCAGSPVPARPGDVGVRRSRRIGASPYRDDGPCQRVAPAPAGGDPAAPGSPGPTSRVAASACGRGGTSAGNGKMATDRGDAVPAVDEDTLRRV